MDKNRYSTYRELWWSLLNLYSADESQAIVRMVLEESFGLSLTDIVSGGIDSLSEDQKDLLRHIMSRLQKGEPVQYILGYSYFRGRKFQVGPGVLIPRPETEELCMLIENKEKDKVDTGKKIVDIGTGSGCIAITLALDLPHADVYAIDISEKALEIARANAKTLDASVLFYKYDALSLPKLQGMAKTGDCQKFDVIVSNPPYVTDGEKKTMNKNVLDYEPSTALFVPNDDPLIFYRAISGFALAHLTKGGGLFFEINPLFADELKSMLYAQGFKNVEILKDSFGKERFSSAFLE